MIYFNFGLQNPFSDAWDHIGAKDFKLSKNKAIEMQLMHTNCIVGVEFRWTIREDHAGVCIELGLLGYNASFNFYDIRHWDHDIGRWIE